MCKAIYPLSVLVLINLSGVCQRKTEHLTIDWPAEYNWKIARQTRHENQQTVMIIPGTDSIENASIIGSMTSYQALKVSNVDEMIDHYKSGIDSGTVFTVIDKQPGGKYPWVIFKVETPVTSKYPEPESDLYYIVQGKFALYENNVAIKVPVLSEEFVKKWTAVFMTGKIEIE